jgi:Recombinase
MSEPRSGPPGCGYQRRNGKLVAEPTEAPIRHRIFELFALHQRKKLVASILNAEGVRTRSSSEWTGTTIGRLIEDATVKGIDGVADPLVAPDLWQWCNDILSGQKESGGASRPALWPEGEWGSIPPRGPILLRLCPLCLRWQDVCAVSYRDPPPSPCRPGLFRAATERALSLSTFRAIRPSHVSLRPQYRPQ